MEQSNIIVKTGVGTFVGVKDTVYSLMNNDTRTVLRFLGIPYAKPPIGELRFSKPVPFGILKSEYNATHFRPHCIQTKHCYLYIRLHQKEFKQSEDCLYLNIYLPEKQFIDGKTTPVMVYIHGGGFGVGGADIYNGDRLSAFHDVIVVTINYRLNVFGFLSDGSKGTGNYGLWDMKLALQWIHDNIAAFGGDNNAVTIFGNSAGGASVLYQATQPSNKGLFQRVIAQSGSNLSPWAYKRNPEKEFRDLVLKSNCHNKSASETMQCLRLIPAGDLKTDYWFTYIPTIDGNFIKDAPLELINATTKSGKDAVRFLSSLDVIIGVTNQDGALNFKLWEGILKHYTNNTATLIAKTMLMRPCDNAENAGIKEIIDLYLQGVDSDNYDTAMNKIIDFETELTMLVPSLLVADMYRKDNEKNNDLNDIYFYIFSQKPDFAPIPQFLSGATHFMEVPYVFGLPSSFQKKLTFDFDALYPENISRKDVLLSNTIMTLWSNFAKSG